jgi:hypothetical protein
MTWRAAQRVVEPSANCTAQTGPAAVSATAITVAIGPDSQRQTFRPIIACSLSWRRLAHRNARSRNSL